MRISAAKNARAKRAPSYPIGSVDNALRLLMLFRKRNRLRVSDAAEELGVARSTAHRLLAMLELHDFVAQDPATRLYIAGPGLTDIGLAIVRDMDIRTIARPTLERLGREVGETVHLLILRGSDALFVDSVESTNVLRVGTRIGMVLPAHSTAGGKALLAQLSRDELRGLYPRERLDRVTKRTVGTRTELFRELDRTKKRRYAVNTGESEADIAAVAAPVLDRQGRLRASVAIAAPMARVNDLRLRRLSADVIRGAGQIGELLP
ncbi:MAG: IclR family transcriptional regulator [Chloroflexota bacterium]|nr:IclR family transcriptional regulator [Chloroflexota bacterium]